MTSSPPRSGRSGKAPWWIWPNLLGLDAPLVALAWLYAIGQVTEKPVLPAAALALFFSVWTIYLADRWFDAGKSTIESNLRHQFGKRHRRAIGVVACMMGSAAACVAWFGLDYLVIGAGVFMALFIGLYFLLFVALAKLPGKELGCGLGFTWGVAVAASAGPGYDHIEFPWLCLVAVAAVNCFVIRFAEEARPSNAYFKGGVVGFALLVPIDWIRRGYRYDRWTIDSALVLAAGLLLGLWYLHSQRIITARATRVLADIALVLPLLLVLAK